jgi:hypothetical protein
MALMVSRPPNLVHDAASRPGADHQLIALPRDVIRAKPGYIGNAPHEFRCRF